MFSFICFNDSLEHINIVECLVLIWILFDFELFIVFRYMQGIPEDSGSGYPPVSTIFQ